MTRSAEVTPASLRARIDRLPRHHLAALPTPCEELPRLAAQIGVTSFRLKRDDLTGLGLGGNKSRTMEFVIGEAIDQGCDTLIAGGGVEQSNHARQCVAAATRAGMDAVVVLQRRQSGFRSNGNLLALQLLGGRIRWVDGDPALQDRLAARQQMDQVAAELRASGHRPYTLASSLHPLGVVAYVQAALELASELGDEHCRIYATSEGAVLGGLCLAARSLGLDWEIVGVDWRPTQPGTQQRLAAVVSEAAALLQLETRVPPTDLRILDAGGPAYGEGSSASWAALDLLARLEGVLLDPVYTAKGMAGALADLQRHPARTDTVVFVHTGGTPALFAYEPEITRHVLERRRPDVVASPAMDPETPL